MANPDILRVDPLSPLIVDKLRVEQATRGSVPDYLRWLDNRYINTNARGFCRDAAKLIIPPVKTPTNQASEHGRIFFSGCVVGLRVVESCISDISQLDDVFAGGSFVVETECDDTEGALAIRAGRAVLTSGQDGLAAYEDTLEPILNSWHGEVSPGSINSYYFDAGVGLPLCYLAQRRCAYNTAVPTVSSLASGAALTPEAWDTAFAELLQ